MNKQTIRVQELIPHAPAKVWRALTEPELMNRWLMHNDFQPTVGHRFSFDAGAWGQTQCEVLAVEPERLISYTWRNGPLDTVITWRLESVTEGTLLSLEHGDFDLDDPMQVVAFEGMGGGWRSKVMQSLLQCLEELPSAMSA